MHACISCNSISLLVTLNREKSSLLNTFFYNYFNNKSPPLLNYLPILPPHDFPQELLCNEVEIYDLIAGLDPSKSTGPDGISVKMLRGTIDAVVSSLTKLFNLSLASGTFPGKWKQAHIVPIPKSPDASSPSNYNYRPISILSITMQ